SFRIKKRYLVAQTPLPETIIEFLTLVVQESCSCIVSFEADIDKQKNSTDQSIPHLQFTDWNEMKNIPRSTANFLSFLNVIEKVVKQQDDGPILVHCLNNLCSAMAEYLRSFEVYANFHEET
ncbi:hypothetical protein MAR_032605, partial [Mya arenaria]